jgi:anti-anti-sigma factor
MTEQFRHATAEPIGGILVFTITEPNFEGDAVAESIREWMLREIEACPARDAAIDFQHVKFISSVAFRPLLALRRVLVDRGGRVVVCGLSPVVGDVFYTTRMIDKTGTPSPMFEIQPTVGEAVAFLQRTDAPSGGSP